jgi:hypothetical protein
MTSFRTSNAQISFPVVETQLRRNLYDGFDFAKVDQNIASKRKLWDES